MRFPKESVTLWCEFYVRVSQVCAGPGFKRVWLHVSAARFTHFIEMERYFKPITRLERQSDLLSPAGSESSECSSSQVTQVTHESSPTVVSLDGAVCHLDLLPDAPNQPQLASFPKVSFGKGTKARYRSFQSSWFDKWPWLHWNECLETVLCHVCMQAVKAGTLQAKTCDQAFISRGFKNWNDATCVFRCHELSACHKEAVERVVTLPATTKHVGELLSSTLAEDRKKNRLMLLHIFGVVRFLGRQGLAFRGSTLSSEADSNFFQLLHLLSENDQQLACWLKKKTNKYTAPDMQNEMLKVMSLIILHEIAFKIRNRPFTIMVDETTDASVEEQCVVVIRWIDDGLEAHEDFVGMYVTASTDANSIVALIKDSLLRMNLSLAQCRGQCYDGAAVMQGCRNGVAVQILREEPRALFTHCYGHSLNLACQDSIRAIKPIKNALDIAFELSKLLKYSSKRNAQFKNIQAEIAPEQPGFRTLCPTRWTV